MIAQSVVYQPDAKKKEAATAGLQIFVRRCSPIQYSVPSIFEWRHGYVAAPRSLWDGRGDSVRGLCSAHLTDVQ